MNITLTPPRRRDGARSLLLTVLGEWVLPDGGQVWTGTLVDALITLGVEEKAARQAIARSAEAGLLRPERRGRRTRWHLTDAADRLLTDGTERIYSFGRTRPPWDGNWVVIFTSVPEASRQLRHRLRTRLGWAGFAPIGPGAWLSPWVDRLPEARATLVELGLAADATSFVGELGPLGDRAALVAKAWTLDQVETDYEAFIERVQLEAPSSTGEAFAALTMLVHEWRHFPTADPDLPGLLLPQPWRGKEAVDLFHRRHRDWKAAARSWWQDHGQAT
jgi:phenylacetic acid degradation operon negative regulatory protein